MIMCIFGQPRWADFIAQKNALISLRWVLSHDINRCLNAVTCVLGVVPFRCTANIFHFVMDESLFLLGLAWQWSSLASVAPRLLCAATPSPTAERPRIVPFRTPILIILTVAAGCPIRIASGFDS